MDLLIPDIWLKDFIKTTATPKEMQKYLSLSGPTVDRINGNGKETVYEVEVTTNRPDAMSIYGIAREVAAILPRYKVKTSLIEPKYKTSLSLTNKVDYLQLTTDKNLTPRSSAILIRDVTIQDSPKWMQERLITVGERPINNIVDISNYIMHELGQPIHMFDYDKIVDHKMIIRESRKGEEITTLDGKTYKLPAGGMVIEDGSGKLIDIPGIMGGKNTAVDKNTKNVLMFVQTYNSNSIRFLAMTLDKWSNAARLFEKGIDTELVEKALRRGVDLVKEMAGGKPEKQALDLYLEKPKLVTLNISLENVQSQLGIKISEKEVSDILELLGFVVVWKNNIASVTPPSYRVKDINIPQDLVEEIARIYGYQNIPSQPLSGAIPVETDSNSFDFEMKTKTILMGLGGSEVYTLSLVSKDEAGSNAFQLANPLGSDSEYLRTSLQPSLIKAVKENRAWKKPIFLFEMANVYQKQKNNLPKEELMLAGIFYRYDFRQAKGIVEKLSEKLNVTKNIITQDLKPIANSNYYYFEVKVGELKMNSQQYTTYQPIPLYPPQVEDITLKIQSNAPIGEVIDLMYKSSNQIKNIELKDIYGDSYTFTIYFQDPSKTLTNEEVATIREKMLNKLNF